jgi:branched-chain amino acid transport system substrate-binding protein
MKVAGLLVFINDVYSLACQHRRSATGRQLVLEPDDASRKFSSASTSTSACLRACRLPTTSHHQLPKAVWTGGTLDGDKVMTTLKGMKIDDSLQQGSDPRRPQRIHDMYLYRSENRQGIHHAMGLLQDH